MSIIISLFSHGIRRGFNIIESSFDIAQRVPVLDDSKPKTSSYCTRVTVRVGVKVRVTVRIRVRLIGLRLGSE